jgi:hypothetical protein
MSENGTPNAETSDEDEGLFPDFHEPGEVLLLHLCPAMLHTNNF